MELRGEYAPSAWQWVRDQVTRYESSGGTEALTLRGSSAPVVVVTSVGARTGKLRKNPVMRVEKDGRYLAVASKGGGPHDPDWVRNVLAHPEVVLQDGPARGTYRARLLEGQERSEWYAYAVSTWSTYGEYETKAAAHGREIPVFLLEPVG